MNTHAPRIARGEGLRGRSDGRAWRAGGGRGGTRRGGGGEPLGGAPRGGPGAGGAVVAGGRDQHRDRDAAGRAGRAGATLAVRVPARRGGGATVAPAAGPDAAQAGGGARGGAGRARGAARRPAGLDPGPARGRGRGAHRRDDLRRSPERGAAKGGYRWRRPRHTLKGRQDARAVDYAGLRLRLLRQQARAGDIHLLFGDESEALTHPYLAHCWARRGAEPRVEARGRAKRRALLDHARRELTVLTSATKRAGVFVALRGRLDGDYGPAPGREDRPVVLVLDNGPIHTSGASRRGRAPRRPPASAGPRGEARPHR